MIDTKKILIIFVPALLIATAGLFIRVVQYEPLFPHLDKTEQTSSDEFNIPLYPDDPILGNKKAPITIIAFEDFACSSCKEQSFILDQLREQYPEKIKIVWKGLPVSTFPYASETAHRYAYCANKQKKFTEFKQYAFTNGDNLSDTILQSIADNIELNHDRLDTCLTDTATLAYLEKTKQIANILNITAVPTFFIDNTQIDNPSTVEGWKMLLQL